MILNKDLFTDKQEWKATRDGLGEGLAEAGKKNKNVYVLTADLGGSTKTTKFKEMFPERFVQVGVAEQNLATVASGLAHMGKIPFITSFSVFSPGRNWEQIRTTICYNNQPVKITSTHSGLGVGEDGATHQALEDIAITRSLPNIDVIVPCDALQAKKAVLAVSRTKKPCYVRLNRQKTPLITTNKTGFKIGEAQVLKEGKHLTIIACGPMVYEALLAAKELEKEKIKVTIINMHTIKPLDKKTIIKYAKKTKKVLTVEDHQVHGGLGGAVAEAISQEEPVKMKIMGLNGFGESGPYKELFKKYGLTYKDIIREAKKLVRKK